MSAIAPDTSGAANEVPDMRVTPPLSSDTRISSPGATMKRRISLPLSFSWSSIFLFGSSLQSVPSSRQTLPGRLENSEILPVGSTEPTTMKVLSNVSFMFTFCVWVMPSLPAAIT